MIIDGKEKIEIIACYLNNKEEEEDKLIILNKSVENGKSIRLRIINKIKDMNEIIEKNELDLSKWNINNVTNRVIYFLDAHLYHLYLIYQNGI